MAKIHPRLACTLVLPLILLGTITTESQAQPVTGVVEDSTNKLQDPLGEPSQPAPKLKIDGAFQSAPTLFREGKFAEAEQRFAWIAQVQKGTTWGERSRYYLAECQYRQQKYLDALESLERLYLEYPATDYIDQVVRREFEIAQHWITWPWPAALTAKKPLLPPNAGEALPPATAEKLALRALEDVRHQSPPSMLAAEASIKIAEYYLAKSDYATAAEHYDQFIAENRKSPSRRRPRSVRPRLESGSSS